VYSSEGGLIAEYGEKRRSPKKIEDIPLALRQAFLAAEDDRFYEHPGVDYQGILRAAMVLVTTGKRGQGGSTITMQLARNFYLSREKTFGRKLNEIFLALKIEQQLSKDKKFIWAIVPMGWQRLLGCIMARHWTTLVSRNWL